MRLALTAMFGTLIMAGVALADSPRQTLKFNDGWKFKLGDNAEASQADFKDADWRSVRVPHDYSIEGPPGADPTTMTGPFDRRSPAGAGGGYLNCADRVVSKNVHRTGLGQGAARGDHLRWRVHGFGHLSQRQTVG